MRVRFARDCAEVIEVSLVAILEDANGPPQTREVKGRLCAKSAEASDDEIHESKCRSSVEGQLCAWPHLLHGAAVLVAGGGGEGG